MKDFQYSNFINPFPKVKQHFLSSENHYIQGLGERNTSHSDEKSDTTAFLPKPPQAGRAHQTRRRHSLGCSGTPLQPGNAASRPQDRRGSFGGTHAPTSRTPGTPRPESLLRARSSFTRETERGERSRRRSGEMESDTGLGARAQEGRPRARPLQKSAPND